MPIIKLLQASNDQSQEVIVWVRVRPDSDYLWLRDAKMAAYNLDTVACIAPFDVMRR